MADGRPRTLPRGARPAIVAGALVACLAPSPAPAQTGGEDCTPSPTTLCLLDDRFQVEVEWHDFSGNTLRLPGTPDSGQGLAVDLGGTNVSDTGFFWFFQPDNVDLIVKALDGRQTNDHFWIFAGSLTNVEYTLRVVDTQTDMTKTYTNPPGRITVTFDRFAFEDPSSIPPKSGERPLATGAASDPGSPRSVFLPAGELPSCGDSEVACVQGDRIAVQVEYNPAGPGPSPPPPTVDLETTTSVLFTLFPDTGPQVAVKVLDGRAVDGRFWIFASNLSLPGLRLTVTDLETHQAVTYVQEGEDPIAVAENDPFAPDPPSDRWLTTPAIPGFRFQVRVTGGGGEIASRQEADCIPETLCISGAIPGRSELFLRMVGPKPNGFLWPNVVKFSTSQLEVWVEQTATGQINYYLLEAASPGSDELTGFFDRRGFAPLD